MQNECVLNQIAPACQWCLFSRLFEAAQEAGRQAQDTIEKAADKATNTIKEFGRRVDGKWSEEKNFVSGWHTKANIF